MNINWSQEESCVLMLADFLLMLSENMPVVDLQRTLYQLENKMQELPDDNDWKLAFFPRFALWKQIIQEHKDGSNE